MIRRTYTGEADLELLQDFNAEAISVTDHCGYLHPGNIPDHIYDSNKHYAPAELMTIWEDDQGVAAWLLVDSRSDQNRPNPLFIGSHSHSIVAGGLLDTS